MDLHDPATQRLWSDLAERSDNVFATYEWLGTWWKHFGRDRRLLLVAAGRGDGPPLAILPVYVAARTPVRTLRLLGHGATDRLGPVCAVGDQARALDALSTYLQLGGGRRWDLAILDELDGETPWLAEGGRVLARRPTRVVRLSGLDGAGWLASRSANLRDQIRKCERRLARTGTVTERTTADPGELAADLDCFFELHRRRWAAAPGGSRAFAGREAFHREVTALALAQGWLRLRFLEVDGEPVAGLYSLRFGGVESSYQASRDPAFDRWSVGLLIHARAIASCADEGVREYRFLRGDEAYKRRLANAEGSLQSVSVAATVVGRSMQAVVGAMPRLARRQQRYVPAPWAWGTGGAPKVGWP